MNCHNQNELAVSPLVRLLTTLSCALALLLAASAVHAADAGDIVVVSTKGEVSITDGAGRTLRAGAVLEPPATVRTGRDGAIELRQGATTVSIGPDTLLEFPALEKRGAPIDRIVQPRGNAFYNIGKRAGRKLRVEAPYLVGVVKGTQFNVAAQDVATTISLFEGLLEVRATDDSDVVDIKAGEIASRKRGERSITVVKMNETAPPTTRPRSSEGGNGNGGGNDASIPAAPRVTGTNDTDADGVRTDLPVSRVVDSEDERGLSVGVDTPSHELSLNAVSEPALTGPGVELNAGIAVTNAIDVGVNAAAGLDSGVDVSAGVNVNAGLASVDAGVNAAVDLGSGVDVSADVNVTAGPASVDIGAGAAIDASATGAAASVDLGVGAGVGTVAADVGAGAAVDLTPAGASAGVDLGTTAGVGDVAVDVGAAAAVDVGASVGAAADVAVDTGVVAADASVAVDASAGTVDLGLGVAGLEVDLGVNLGLDDSTITTPGADTTPETAPVIDVGGLLDSLLRRPGRR